MPRGRRRAEPGWFVHVIVRGNGRQNIFIDDASRERFMRLVLVASRRTGCEVHADCLMDNHAHLLIRVGLSLSNMMKELLHRYAQYLHARRGTDGHVFQGRFKSYVCTNDRYLLNVLRYIHRNPVKHGACANVSDWKWSSHRAYVGEYSPLIKTDYLLSFFGGSKDRGEAYRRFMDAKADAPWPHGLKRRRQRREAPAAPKQAPAWLPPLPEALNAFAMRNGLSAEDLIKPSKARELADLRRKFAKQSLEGGYSLSDIGRALRRAKQSVHRLIREC